jgi:hypothetical protein
MIAAALDAHAQAVLEGELKRRHALLQMLPSASRSAVEQTARQTLAAVTAAIFEHAEREPAVAAALHSIYAAPGHHTVAPAAAGSD